MLIDNEIRTRKDNNDEENKMKVDDKNKQIDSNSENEIRKDEFDLKTCILKNKLRNSKGKLILNRRKNKLDEMIKNEDEFFSEDAIKERDVLILII